MSYCFPWISLFGLSLFDHLNITLSMPFNIGNICNSNGPPFCVFKTYHVCQLILSKKCPLLFYNCATEFQFRVREIQRYFKEVSLLYPSF